MLSHFWHSSTRRGAAPAFNLRLYCVFLASTGFALDRTLFLVYMTERGLDVRQAALCEAIFQLAVVVFEVPTGWVSDRFGRKISIGCGIALLGLYHLAMLASGGFMAFAGSMALGALAMTFLSGSDTSLLYELVERSEGRERYLSFSSKALAGQQIMLGVSAVLGALLASWSWTALYLGMAVFSIVQLAMLVLVREPAGGPESVLDMSGAVAGASGTAADTTGAATDSSGTAETGRSMTSAAAASAASTASRSSSHRSLLLRATHWTTFAPAWLFVAFLAVTAALDQTAMSYAMSSSMILDQVGVALPLIGLFAGGSQLINAAAYICANRLAQRFGRRRVFVWTSIALVVVFALLPVAAALSPLALLAVSLPALFAPELLYAIVESIAQDHLVNATRARVLSAMSMMESLYGFGIYAVLGAALQLWGVPLALVLLAGVIAALTIAAFAGLRWARGRGIVKTRVE